MQLRVSEDFLIPSIARIENVYSITSMEKIFEISTSGTLNHTPGQFVEVSVFGYGEAPISICSSPTRGSNFEVCVRKAGRVTQALHSLKKLDTIGIRGPYGRGFPVEDAKNKDILIVAGGIGIAPLRSLIQYIVDKRENYGRLIILMGAKTPQELLFIDELKDLRKNNVAEVHLTVDRADALWNECVGVVTVLFKRIKIEPVRTLAFVVGPPVMFKFVLLELESLGMAEQNIYVSLERHMKCGIGRCGHCQINGLYVCREGPVFSYAELKSAWEAFAWKR